MTFPWEVACQTTANPLSRATNEDGLRHGPFDLANLTAQGSQTHENPDDSGFSAHLLEVVNRDNDCFLSLDAWWKLVVVYLHSMTLQFNQTEKAPYALLGITVDI